MCIILAVIMIIFVLIDINLSMIVLRILFRKCVQVVDALPLEPPEGRLLVPAAISKSILRVSALGAWKKRVWSCHGQRHRRSPSAIPNLVEIVFMTTACKNVRLFVVVYCGPVAHSK